MVLNLVLIVKEAGLHWFAVALDGLELTRASIIDRRCLSLTFSKRNEFIA